MEAEVRHHDPRVTRLQNQIRWVTRLSIALGSTQSVEDVYSVLLSGLLSPSGLGCSRVVALDYDPTTHHFHGRMDVGYESKDAVAQFERDIQDEERALRERRNSHEETVRLSPEQEPAIYNMYAGAEWLTALNRLGMDDDMARAFGQLNFEVQVRRREGVPRDILSECIHWRYPRRLDPEEYQRRLPEEISARLEGTAIAVPIFTQAGLLGILFVDRRFDGGAQVTDEDLEDLGFFANQSALAISNARLIGDLNRALQDLKELDTIKSNFLSTISHELRTPLTAMIGFVDLVAGEKVGPLTPTQETLMSRVQKNTRHMITMVNDLIDIAELQVEGMRDRNLIAIDPLDVLMKTIPQLENRRRDKKGDIDPILPTDGIPKVLSHEDSLRRILYHLLDNAIKFSPGNANVEVIFEARGGVLAISIRDHGIGIPKEKLARIFEQFYQVDNSMTRSQEGLGLGLTVTRMLAQSIKASLKVESEVGRGSTFTVELPLAH